MNKNYGQIKFINSSLLDFEDKENAHIFINKLIKHGIKNIHYDVMDQQFATNSKSFTLEQIKLAYKNANIHTMDVHLMVKDPENWIKELSFVDYISFHYEAVGAKKALELVKKYQTKDLKLGLAINPSTSFEEIKDLISHFKLILVMSVEAGAGGQAFQPEILNKISQIKEYILQNSLDTKIMVDGGIKKELLDKVFLSGVDFAVMGSYILKNDDEKTLKELNSQALKWKQIYLAGGCFWGMQAWLKLQRGAIKTWVGYANSDTLKPSYQDLINKKSKAVETVEFIYDSSITSLDKILYNFLLTIDPTSLNFQANDIGLQYRNGIYWNQKNFSEQENTLIEQEILNTIKKAQENYQKPIVTEVLNLENFYLAEEYHQDYLDKNPGAYCHIKL
ncbi:peptide-methionine (S)-S-oxide reductase MsrA [Mycoplasma zalophi]|nr:peptide-methionine (S)-S-oxide reductase MsrA [Mycoplasma zalophi]